MTDPKIAQTSKDDNELIQRVCRGVASIQEGERLRAYIAGLQSALERSQHQITMLLGARAPVETTAVDYVQFGWVPYHEKQGCDPDSYVEHEEDRTEIIEGWRWVPAYAAVTPEKARVVPSVCGKPMPDGKGAGQCINPPGHEGDCDDMPF